LLISLLIFTLLFPKEFYSLMAMFCGSAEELKTYGDEVLNELRGLLGVNEFVQAYNSVRQRVKDLQEKRKRAQKLNVLVDPERNAKRKIRLNQKRQAQKKRKIVDLKRQRGL